MKNILIIGATGNVGIEVIKYLFALGTENNIIAGVRNIDKAMEIFKDYPKLSYINFDIENPELFDNLPNEIDCIFLLRPPHISKIDKYFRPLIKVFKGKGIKGIVFLSVQGAEKSNVIPHNKIEKLIVEFDINHIFLRPSYFMQNLTTTLLSDIKSSRKIILPAGKAKFNWIDVQNIGEISALVLENFEKFKNQAIELTGNENENFQSATDMINEVCENKILYVNTNPFRFFFMKKQEGMAIGMIIVIILLHYLPRFQKEPQITRFYEKLTGKQPTSLQEFIYRERKMFE